MARRIPKRGDLVVVTWLDAVQHADGETNPRHEPHVMKTCGYLLQKNRKGISIAGEFCPTDATWRNENFIPAGMIQSVEIVQSGAEDI